MPSRLSRKDHGSVSLWVALVVPVLMSLFFWLFLGLLLQGNDRVSLQDAGDLSVLAAAGTLDAERMLSGQVVFDEVPAAESALAYLGENYASQGLPLTEAFALLSGRGLALDADNRPTEGLDGITVRFLYPGTGVDPLTGGFVIKPTVLLVSRVTVRRQFGGDTRYTTYSMASPVSTAMLSPSSDGVPPSQVTGLLASSPTSGTAELSWNPASDDTGVFGYDIQYSLAPAFSSPSVLGSTVATAAATGLASGTPHYFRVRAYDAAGNTGAWSTGAVLTP